MMTKNLMYLPGPVKMSGKSENPPNVERRRKYRACSRLSNANKLKIKKEFNFRR
jgi:hypothetical protein